MMLLGAVKIKSDKAVKGPTVSQPGSEQSGTIRFRPNLIRIIPVYGKPFFFVFQLKQLQGQGMNVTIMYFKSINCLTIFF